MGERLGEIWKRITIWQKMAVIVLFIMWVGISFGVIVSFDVPWWAALVLMCLIWLAYIGIAFVITKPHGQELDRTTVSLS